MISNKHYRRGLIRLATIFSGLILFSILCVQWDMDRKVAGLFFSESKGWHFVNKQPWQFINQYGTIPGIVLSVLALLGYFYCQIKDRYRSWRNNFLLIVLTSIIGAGLIVNTILKPYWGRPRPNQTIEFGGMLEYRPFYVPGEPGRGKSFTCGHSTMGFLFVTLLFFYRRSRAFAYAGLIAGLTAGGLLSAARIVEGAHYLSDNVWSLGIILITATTLHYFFLRIPLPNERDDAPLSMKKKIIMGCSVFLVCAAMVFFFSYTASML